MFFLLTNYIFPFLCGFLSCRALLFFILPFLSRFFLDTPNFRSSHAKPTPRGGGVGFVIVSIASILFFRSIDTSALIIFMTSFPLSIISFLDDRFSVPAIYRYLIQFSCSLVCVYFSPFSFLGSTSLIFFFLLLVLTFTAIVNFINFMDGADGLVGLSMFICFAALAFKFYLPPVYLVLVGALLSFLFMNWSPARIFMGDVGSTFLGFVFFATVLYNSTSLVQILNALLICSPLLFDSLFCLLRRLLAGQSIFQPHRLHLYQRLCLAGFSHSYVSLLYGSATLALSIVFLFGTAPTLFLLSLALFFFGLYLDKFVAVPFEKHI